MLILDFSDDLLDEILDRDKTVRTAILVYDESEMDACRLHFYQKIEHRHGRRHEKHFAPDRTKGEGRSRRRAFAFNGGEPGEHVFQVHHADRIVEGLAIDRHARMARIPIEAQNLFHGRRFLDADHIRPRHHDVIDTQFTELQDVDEHVPLFGGQAAMDILMLLDDLLEAFAERAVAIAVQPQQGAQPAQTVTVSRIDGIIPGGRG